MTPKPFNCLQMVGSRHRHHNMPNYDGNRWIMACGDRPGAVFRYDRRGLNYSLVEGIELLAIELRFVLAELDGDIRLLTESEPNEE